MAKVERRQRIGLYGGTFDPVHLGHLNLAVSLQEARDLDALWFCPALSSPHKQQSPGATFAQRVEMLRLATEDLTAARVITVEGERPPPSYTVDTVEFLLAQYPQIEIYLILGDDSIAGLPRWKDVDRLLTMVKILIGSRHPHQINTRGFAPNIQSAVTLGLVETPLFDVSATLLRDRLKINSYCGHLLPQKVLDYIRHSELYSF